MQHSLEKRSPDKFHRNIVFSENEHSSKIVLLCNHENFKAATLKISTKQQHAPFYSLESLIKNVGENCRGVTKTFEVCLLKNFCTMLKGGLSRKCYVFVFPKKM